MPSGVDRHKRGWTRPLSYGAKTLRYRVRAAFDLSPTAAPATIYDAAGRPVARMDPVTRQRTAL